MLLNKIEQATPTPSALHAAPEALAARTQQTAVLAAISGGLALFIDTVDSLQAVCYSALVGKRAPLRVTGTGLAVAGSGLADGAIDA